MRIWVEVKAALRCEIQAWSKPAMEIVSAVENKKSHLRPEKTRVV